MTVLYIYTCITGIILKRLISLVHILFNYICQNRIFASNKLICPSIQKLKTSFLTVFEKIAKSGKISKIDMKYWSLFQTFRTLKNDIYSYSIKYVFRQFISTLLGSFLPKQITVFEKITTKENVAKFDLSYV